MLGVLAICSLFLVSLNPHLLLVEDGYLSLSVRNTTDEPVSNVTITCTSDCSTANVIQGKVRIKLPPQTRPGDWAMLQIVKRPRGPDWVLISPWDYRVIVPSFDNKPDNAVSVIVARRGDRQILSSGNALEAIAARTLKEITQKLDWQISDEERKLVLNQQAEAVGLTAKEVDQAIREWGSKAKDPYQQGLAALYEENYSKSTELLMQSYLIRKRTFQKVNIDYIDSAFFLGQSLYGQGKYNEAVGKFQEVVSLKEDDAGALNWLGLSLLEAGRYVEAEPIYKQALEILEKAFGKEDPHTATGFNNLAKLYRSLGRYIEAELLYKRALYIREKWLRNEHPDIARSLNNLAVLYYTRGRYTEAELLYKRALDIFEKALGKEQPDTAQNLNNLAELYRAQGRYAEAEPLYKRAVEIYEMVLGKEHPYTATGLNNLAELYKVQRRYAEAEPLCKRALDIFEKTLGKDHLNVATVLENYADLLRKIKRDDEAATLEARVKIIRARHSQ